MIAPAVKDAPDALRMASMNTYQTDSRGKRIAWARKQAMLTGAELARAVGVRNVTISYIENDHRDLSLPLLMKIAEVADTTVGFLLAEIDYAKRIKAKETMEAIAIFEGASDSQREQMLSILRTGIAQEIPPYISPEADAAAELIDDAPPEERARILAVVRALAAPDMPEENKPDLADVRRKKRVISSHDADFAQRLIHRDKVVQPQTGERARS